MLVYRRFVRDFVAPKMAETYNTDIVTFSTVQPPSQDGNSECTSSAKKGLLFERYPSFRMSLPFGKRTGIDSHCDMDYGP